MELDPGGIIGWIIVGIVAGWLAGRLTGGGRGLVGDLILGLIGAFIGDLLFSLLGISGSAGLIGSIVVATIGAVIVVFVVRAVTRRRRGAERHRVAAAQGRRHRRPSRCLQPRTSARVAHASVVRRDHDVAACGVGCSRAGRLVARDWWTTRRSATARDSGERWTGTGCHRSRAAETRRPREPVGRWPGGGGNSFLSVRDPSGNRIEITADVARLPNRWEGPRIWRGELSAVFNVWTEAPPPASFGDGT
ncbi:GlsB/YeaQ/YmgE family stress response membrane protein [Thermomicrobium sp. 4228-Ro]|nr:GlsB/YeaQ/YmgE family stress response membrane protein [Thermomicrobium sp. 4228-Ro]MCX2728506.1 GlsB/YeaQ/YmgE family stress response membrane protein [Thermomicrobium sp. 4228-Ro]